MVHSSSVVKSGWESLYLGCWSHLWVNPHNQWARSSNSSVELQRVLTSIIGRTAMWTLAFWQSMNSFRWPGVSVINPGIIFHYMKVSFRTLKISWKTYFLIYHCQTWSHGRQLFDSSIAFFSKSVTFPNVYAFILCILLIALMGFPQLGAAFYTQTAHECT